MHQGKSGQPILNVHGDFTYIGQASHVAMGDAQLTIADQPHPGHETYPR